VKSTALLFAEERIYSEEVNINVIIFKNILVPSSGYEVRPINDLFRPRDFISLVIPLTPRVVTGEKNSPTVAHACRKRRLKWVLGAWGITGPPSLEGI
jgi:hypothetical protein